VSDSDDLALVYFSGHGGYMVDDDGDEADGFDEYLVFGDREVLDDEVAEWMAPLTPGELVVIVDSCFSGGMVKGSPDLVKSGSTGGGVAKDDGFVADLMRPLTKGGDIGQHDDCVIITGCDDYESSYFEPAVGSSWLTYYLSEALQTQAADTDADGYTSAEEAYAYAAPLVTGENSDQHPQIQDNYDGQIPLVSWVQPPTPDEGDFGMISVGGNVTTFQAGRFNEVKLHVGGRLGSFSAAMFPVGRLQARDLGQATVNGLLGADVVVESPNSKPNLTIRGGIWSGRVDAAGDMGTVQLTDGAWASAATLVVQGDLTRLEAPEMSGSHVAVRGDVDTVNVGVMTGSEIGAGGDLDRFTADSVVDSRVMAGYFAGPDGVTQTDDDVLRCGDLGTVTVQTLEDSSFAAGVGAGQDGLYGTNDDTALEGVSEIDSLAADTVETPTTYNAIIAGTGLGSITEGGSDLVSQGLLTVGTRVNVAGPPRVLYAEQIGTTVEVKFSEAVLPQTVNEQTFLVEMYVDPDYIPLDPASVSWDPQRNTAVYDNGLPWPSAAWWFDATVLGTGAEYVTDIGGRALAGDPMIALPLLPGLEGSNYVYTW